jgi:sulfatase maturation enzyme AslB (radical SAM superfamily)
MSKEGQEQYAESPTFCILPWIHLATTVDGVWGRCCFDATNDYDEYYRKPVEPSFDLVDDALGCTPNSRYAKSNPQRAFGFMDAFNSAAMKQTRLEMLAGEEPAACRHCFAREASGAASHRQAMNAEFAQRVDMASLLAATTEDGELNKFPLYLDLRFGNTCNLACIMCSYPISSKLGQGSRPVWATAQIDPFRDDDEFWKELAANAHRIRNVYFAGGEPFMQAGHYRALDLLTESGAAPQMELHYNSNLTMLPKNGFDQLKRFKSVVIAASCDGTGEVFEKIRVGGQWATFSSNLRTAKEHVEVWLDVSLQRENIGNIRELVDFARSEGVRARFENYVDYPRELSARSIPMAQRQAYAAAILDLAADCHRRSEGRMAHELELFVTYLKSA